MGRLTKPLSFADCVGDELPWGWEAGFDPQIGVYYIDHINKTTQIEDPRKQWRGEQEKMLKDYLSVAQDALRTQKELYHVKEQRLALALDEYVRLNDAYKEKSSSRTSLFSGSSSSTKYDPDILKAEISTTRLRVKKLKRELSQMKQELLYKEQGFETLQQIDKKMSGGQSGYELSEAKAILTELKSIRKAISSGEKEKQDLMQSLAKLQERFHLDQNIGRSEPDLRSSPVNSHLSLSRQTLDAGSQTSISGDIGVRSRSNLAEKVRLSLQYEEAKRSMANLKIELSKLDSEAWPGALDIEKEKLMLINEKEELLKELQFVTPQKRTQDELEHLEAERQRLEEELLSVRGAPSRALAERLRLEERRKELLQKLEETTKLTTYLHSQLKSLSASTLSMSSGSSLGSLASSRGSLNTSSRGSLNSLSSTELYYSSQSDQIDVDYQYKLDFLLQEKSGYIPSGPITTIHENEVVKSPSQPGQSGLCGVAAAATGHTPPLAEAPKSVASLSSRSSLSSLSPPGSPLVLEGTFPLSSHDASLHQFSADFEDCELSSHFADISLVENQILLDSDSGGASQSLSEDKDLNECAGEPLYEGTADVEKSLPKRRVIHLLGEKTTCVSAAVSDESVAGDSGVYEAFVKQPSEIEDVTYSEEDIAIVETAQVQIGLRYNAKSSSFMVIIAQLRNLHAFLIPHTSKVYFRVAVLPSSTDVSCLFRTKVHPPTESILFNDVFRVAISQTALQQKTLRVDLCSVSRHRREECLAGSQISLADLPCSSEVFTLWYNLLPSKQMPCKKSEGNEDSVFQPSQPLGDSVDLDAVSALLARTSAELLAVEQELAQEEEEEESGQEEQRGPDGDWLTMLREASNEIVAKKEAEVKLPEDSNCTEDLSSRTSVPEMNEDGNRKENNCAKDLRSQPPAGTPTLVDKETNTDEAANDNMTVRPKERSSLSSRQHPFVRSSVIVRSQTFSPGERSQYICRLNRSDSDSSTLAKKSLFVRNSTERRSLRVKRTVCQSVLRRTAQECPVRTSLDLELDLQASLTRQSRLNDELQALRDLRQKLEELKAQGETDLPPGVLEDERFQKLLKQAEKQAEQSKEEQKQGLNAEKLMRQVSKDVCRLREQSQKVPRQVQSFREKIAYFTRAKISIPSLPADDV
ncbi:protein WWC2 isoform X2 [Trachypithecus francoisi]|uniref:protein WWC2 isoform X2 n=1 Tax=Trachypithecus francoisi TaxID=54180 RepID=UPI00141B6E2D|nr:protein WWC2 isoform X2 [Trachypithecus francoisi]XP_033071653.1 protein WWC2 isoform X2 [Trachypithecus francoisi]